MPHTLTPEQNFFRAIPQLAVLDSEQIFELARKTTKQKYRKGEYVFLQGEQVERLYFLEMGRVEIYKSDVGGRKLTLWYIEESDIFCLATIFAPEAFASAVVLEDALIYSLARNDFEEIIARSSALSRNLIRCICGKLATYSAILDDVAFRKIEVRLAKIILRNLTPLKGGEQICQLSQDELASLAGTSREVAARCLKLFRERGVVSGAQPGRPRNIVITRPEELQRIVDEE